ncbi:MAG: hypothetical protein A2X49_15365 [Lentisphaerae bacterium GWF2_52_8]|nr:MAG: hypothetical protein A2X49_15365 [Lentisphaerae bacterium GWF2_52_8]
MIPAMREFLLNRLLEIRQSGGDPAFSPGNIFFGPMPRDFLKDNAYAACCLLHQDTKKYNGSLTANVRNEECTFYTRTRKVFNRVIVCRVVLFAAEFKDQWGENDFKGFIDQLENEIAKVRVIPDSLNMAVRIELQDSIRPWDTEEAQGMLKRLPHKAITRVVFTGGVYKTIQIQIVQDVDLQPSYE